MQRTIARERGKRVDVRLPSVATRRELRELGAFVRFCIGRIERELGTFDRWIVSIGPTQTGGYTSTVTTIHDGITTCAEGAGQDGTLAAWNALGNIEQSLRELAARSRLAAAV